LLVPEINKFREIRTTLTQPDYDTLVRDIAARIQYRCSDNLALGRIDEYSFALLLEVDRQADHAAVAARLLQATEVPYRHVIKGVVASAHGDARNVYDIEFEKLPDLPQEPKPDGDRWVRRNYEHNGCEIFLGDDKPPKELITRMKHRRWRATKNRGFWVWYKRYSSEAWREGHEFCGLPLAPEPPHLDDRGNPDAGYVQAQEDAYHDNAARAIGL
jgi:hypothetical protein